ncbi:MAG: hypothetical protein GY751_12690 [Bacteroidetes bacterium]|nr:hypothetical protein [Bacteroidota bacterium]
MRYRFIFSLLMVVALVLSCNKDEDQIASFTDARDGQTYRIVTIGDQIWMAENLNYIPPVGMSWCYDLNPANCDEYGLLYDWHTALTIAPDGWHLPSDAEWDELINFLGGSSVAGGKMKEEGRNHWDAPNTGATNESGFTGLPAGFLRDFGNPFVSIQVAGIFWSSTENNSTIAWCRSLSYDKTIVSRGAYDKSWGFSVRCIKD